MFLTAEQLIEVTGFRRPSAQVRWLSRAGMRFCIGGDGRVKVLKAEIDRYLLSGPVKQEPHLRLVGL